MTVSLENGVMEADCNVSREVSIDELRIVLEVTYDFCSIAIDLIGFSLARHTNLQFETVQLGDEEPKKIEYGRDRLKPLVTAYNLQVFPMIKLYDIVHSTDVAHALHDLVGLSL